MLEGVVADTIFEGERLLYVIDVPALQGELQIYHHDPTSYALFDVGAPVHLGWNARDLLVFSPVR